jgi:hypothetical protein
MRHSNIKRGPGRNAERRDTLARFHRLDLRKQHVLFPCDRLESLLKVVLRPKYGFDLPLRFAVSA